MASTVDIPVELPVVLTPPMESVTPDLQDSVESELMHLHECEDDDDDDDDTEDLGGVSNTFVIEEFSFFIILIITLLMISYTS